MRREPGTAPPPSERGEERRHRRRSLLRYGAWGWGPTLLLAGVVIAIVVLAVLWVDPERNPAPEAYVAGTCRAFDHVEAAVTALGEAATALDRGEAAGASDAADRAADAAVAAADASADRPDWPPGEPLSRAMAEATLFTLSGVAEVRDGDAEAAAAERDAAAQRLATGRGYLDELRFGFACD